MKHTSLTSRCRRETPTLLSVTPAARHAARGGLLGRRVLLRATAGTSPRASCGAAAATSLYGSEAGTCCARSAASARDARAAAQHALLWPPCGGGRAKRPWRLIRTRIQRASRRHIAKELDPETVRRRARVRRCVGGQSFPRRAAGTPGVRGGGTERGPARDGRRRRHLREVSYGAGTVNPDPAASMARRVARQLAKVQAPHVPWEGTTRNTKRLSSIPTWRAASIVPNTHRLPARRACPPLPRCPRRTRRRAPLARRARSLSRAFRGLARGRATAAVHSRARVRDEETPAGAFRFTGESQAG